jgi:hypothetical protein
MCDKEKLMEKLLLDMKHWSIPALKEARLYIDDQVLSQNGEDFLWWWELKKAIDRERARKEGWHCENV